MSPARNVAFAALPNAFWAYLETLRIVDSDQTSSRTPHREFLVALHQSKMDQVTLQAIQIMLVPHPSILENLESLDLENGTVADIANIGIELLFSSAVDYFRKNCF